MPITSTPNNTLAFCYGGVFDIEEDEENLSGIFYNDFYQLDLEKLLWRNVNLSGNKEKDAKPDLKPQIECDVERVEEIVKTTTISDDGIFKVTVGPSSSTTLNSNKNVESRESVVKNSFQPSPRINCGLAIKHGQLYLYGGMFEDGDKQITFNDFYSVDLKKLDEWKVLIADDVSKAEWLGSGSESEDSSEEEETSDSADNENDEDPVNSSQ